MAHMVKLTDGDIRRIANANVSGGRYLALVTTVMEIAIREKGSTISIGFLEDVLKDTPFLNRSVAMRIVDDLEELFDQQQQKRAA